jgi:sortase A
MAHNYASHFGGLSKLSEGDSVIFTDMDGIVTAYEVVAQDVLAPNAVEEMTSGDFDLTLFTCTYGGKSRVTVYCDRAS